LEKEELRGRDWREREIAILEREGVKGLFKSNQRKKQ
jgi:hypothetical protein